MHRFITHSTRTFAFVLLCLLVVSLAACVGVIEGPASAPPVSNAGPDQHIFRTASGEVAVVLDGSTSCALSGDPLEYEWHQVSGRPATLVGLDTDSLEIRTESRGAFTFALQVRVAQAGTTLSSELDYVNVFIDDDDGEDVVPEASTENLCGKDE